VRVADERNGLFEAVLSGIAVLPLNTDTLFVPAIVIDTIHVAVERAAIRE